VFGPRQDYNGKCGVINIFLYNILNGKPPIIWGSGEQIKCFTYVTDSIAAALLLLEKDESIGEIYNVASEVRISISDLANLLIDRYAENKNMKPLNVQAKKGENMRPIPDTSKIKELGWNKEYKLNYGLDLTKIWLEDKLKYENSKRINLSKPAD
jgi:UDP-glucose 4-epimerase